MLNIPLLQRVYAKGESGTFKESLTAFQDWILFITKRGGENWTPPPMPLQQSAEHVEFSSSSSNITSEVRTITALQEALPISTLQFQLFIGIMKLKNSIKPYIMIHGVINKTYILTILTVRAEHELLLNQAILTETIAGFTGWVRCWPPPPVNQP